MGYTVSVTSFSQVTPMKTSTRRRMLALASLPLAGTLLSSPRLRAQDRLLDEIVSFTGAMLFLDARVPALILGAVRDGRTAVFGFGETSDGSGKEPDGNTMLRIGSITKAFTGQVLAGLVSQGTVRLTDRLQDRLGWPVKVPERDGRPIRLIELATHTSGLPREVERTPGPPDDPFRTLTQEAYVKGLQSDPLLFTPGSGGLYSNFAFDLLAAALASSAGKPYDQILREIVLDPAGMKDTVLALRDGDAGRVMQGHFFDGKAMPTVRATSVMAGASSLYSTANDILRWLAWHLDRFSPRGAEVRLLDHAAYVPRDGLKPVSGFDEAGHMDAMGLGWIVMAPKGSRPLILQKAGGLQGIFSYSAFAPTRGVGVFAAMNQFNVGAFTAMAGAANGLIEQLAPR